MNLDREPRAFPSYSSLALIAAWCLACGGGGATFGENAPGDPQYGGGTYLDDARVSATTPDGVGENGSIAVDPDTETVFTVQVRNDPDGSGEQKRLVAVRDDGARSLLDLTSARDVRILFPADSVVVLAEWCEDDECIDHMFWFEKESLRPLREKVTGARYHGTRLSSKRNWLVVAQNNDDPSPLHLLDLRTGDTNAVPTTGEWYEAMWLHREDTLVMAHFSDLAFDDDGGEAFLTIKEWFPNADSTSPIPGSSVCFVPEGEARPESCDAVAIPGIAPTWAAGFSWIGVSKDDRWVAVPARTEEKAVVALVDRDARTMELIEDAFGPVGFTPDGKTMVAYGFDSYSAHPDSLAEWVRTGHETQDAHMIFIDLETRERTHAPLPQDRAPLFFVSHDTNEVVVVPIAGGTSVAMYDLDADQAVVMSGPKNAEAAARSYVVEQLIHHGYDVDRTPLEAARELEVRERVRMRTRDDRCVGFDCDVSSPTPVTLSEFVMRRGHRELWMIESRSLLRFDLDDHLIQTIPIDGIPRHIAIQPQRDRIVVDSRGAQRLRYVDPDTWGVDRVADISLGWGE